LLVLGRVKIGISSLLGGLGEVGFIGKPWCYLETSRERLEAFMEALRAP